METTMKMLVELTYSPEMMHGVDQEAIDWFNNDILSRTLLLYSPEIGDNIGMISVLDIVKAPILALPLESVI